MATGNPMKMIILLLLSATCMAACAQDPVKVKMKSDEPLWLF
jgi:hypothetical protein